ncbi:MAG: tRNA preQ1(34) S-adenosylmethionine ribosyltransferase-isomerase QueA [Planctomycetes bacterium]|nr:tRNA preQ1(34) S-adenosylmethionine ribosyltransferase-isomerase QueA [Planctomycetota bacterium]MBI3847287.1 tRNA preQ1(34) S-adenosylmethionine ribosyltransferase-isomerase QueA [Planctomycetota bacterium]
MKLDDFDYDLPQDRIAQEPLAERDASRLLVLPRHDGPIRHRSIRDLPDELGRGDVLVVNDTRVRPCRLVGRRATGGVVKALVLGRAATDGDFEALVESGGRLHAGETIRFEEGRIEGVVGPEVSGGPIGLRLVRFGGALEERLREVGRAPLPPYIRRPSIDDPRREQDRARYQTVFAEREGAVAAPTAGLHFTPRLLADLESRGVELARVTLHVGVGTFAPIRTESVEDHRMHAEWADVGESTVVAVRRALANGRRVVAVGTTSCRALETAALRSAEVGGPVLAPFSGPTDLYILPGFQFRVVDALLTNFHQPRSTLLCLVSAFAGRERILEAYREALESGYRFLSYGDAMLIVCGRPSGRDEASYNSAP